MLLKSIAIVMLVECAFIIGSAQADCNLIPKKVYIPEYSFKTNWYNASLTCNSQGLRLASIESEEEQKLLEEMIISQGLEAEQFYLSGTDLALNSRWSWFSTGKALTYTNWLSTSYPLTTSNSDCLVLYSQLKWISYTCNGAYYFICEKTY